MIGRLRGIVIEKRPPLLVLDVHGVGYEVEAPSSTFDHVPELGKEMLLYTHMVVREDAQLLYGFAKESDRAIFRQLLKVTGIGAKIAIGILSGISADGFVRCVQDRDALSLTRLPGVGKKTAERLIVELRDRLSEFEFALPMTVSTPRSNAPDPVSDAVSALIALGYKPNEASRWVGGVDVAGLRSDEIIRRALQLAAR